MAAPLRRAVPQSDKDSPAPPEAPPDQLPARAALTQRHGGGDGAKEGSASFRMSLLQGASDNAHVALGNANVALGEQKKTPDSGDEGTYVGSGWGESGRIVPDKILDNLQSIPCLEAKRDGQSYATPCGGTYHSMGASVDPVCLSRRSETLTIATYPKWNEPCCNGAGGYFCDPDKVLSREENAVTQQDIEKFSSTHSVACPRLMPYHAGNGTFNQRMDRSFRLGIAIAKDFPAGEADPDSLANFGLLLLNKWGLHEQRDLCPHSAILILLTGVRQAFVASASCEFICNEKGGPEVVTAMLEALDTKGAAAAIEAGVETAGRIIRQRDRFHREARLGPGTVAKGGLIDRLAASEYSWKLAQQILLGIALITMVVSVLTGTLIFFVPSARDTVLGASDTRKLML